MYIATFLNLRFACLIAQAIEQSPPSRWAHQSAIVDGSALVWGGQTVDKATGERQLLSNDEIWRFNTSNGQWSMKTVSGESETPPPCAAGRCCVAVESHLVYSYGGWNSKEERAPIFYEDLYVLDGKRMNWKKAREKRIGVKPMGRKDCGMSMYGESVVITGGYGLKDKKYGRNPGREWEEMENGEGCNNDQFLFDTRRCKS